MIVGKRALAHQRMGHRDAQPVHQRRQFGRRIRQQDAAAGIDQGLFGARAAWRRSSPPPFRRVTAWHSSRALELDAIEECGIQFGGENIHRHRHQDRPGTPALRQMERLVDDLGKKLGPVHPPGALDERPVDLELVGIGVKVDLLVRMLAVEMGGNIARDHHHRNGIQRRRGHPGRGVGEARPQMRQDHGGLLLGACITVGAMRRDLLMPGVDEADRAFAQLGEHGDVGMPAEPEDVGDAPPFEIPDQLLGNQLFHPSLLCLAGLARAGAGIGVGNGFGHRALHAAAAAGSLPRRGTECRPSAKE